MSPIERQVRCDLVVNATTPVSLALHVSASGSEPAGEQMTIAYEDQGRFDEWGQWSPTPGFESTVALTPTVVPADHDGRVHLYEVPVGLYRFTYEATVASAAPTSGPTVAWRERLAYLRPSRYCPSDRMFGWANREFGRVAGDRARVDAIVAWVGSHVEYASDSTSPVGDAAGTLLSGRGVCRDFAHLVATACRALDIPARVVAVYAPGLFPMDFHAVVEACLDEQWYVFDATGLAPRTGLVRIATGRDAADNAFLTVVGGLAELHWTQVTAITTGPLPADDPDQLVRLA